MEPHASQSSACPWWLLFTFDNPLRRLIHDPRQILEGMLAPGGTALDVGCGMGYFTLTLARMAGSGGRVIAADLQEQMLAGLRRRASRAGLLDRITLLRTSSDRIGLEARLDFALAFWMVHEVPRPKPFLEEILAVLKPGGKLLIVEPVIHVPAGAFARTVDLAQGLGFTLAGQPAVRISRAALLIAKSGGTG